MGEPFGGRMILEKEPLLTADLALPLRLFPDCRILMPLRDPRDVIVSSFFTLIPLAPTSVAAASIADACLHYAETMRHWLLLRERLPGEKWCETRYEDLVADPEQQLRRLTQFLQIDYLPELLSPSARLGARPMSTPTHEDVTRPIYRRSLGRWRQYQKWLEPHLSVLQPFLEAFGYE